MLSAPNFIVLDKVAQFSSTGMRLFRLIPLVCAATKDSRNSLEPKGSSRKGTFRKKTSKTTWNQLYICH